MQILEALIQEQLIRQTQSQAFRTHFFPNILKWRWIHKREAN